MANKGDSLETSIEKRDSIFYGWIVLSVAFIILVLGYAIRNTFSVFYPAIVEEFGWGIGTAAPVFFTTVADLFQGKHFGSIQGAVVLGFSLGGAIAPWLAGFLHDKTGTYFSTLFILLGSLLISILLMWLVAPRKIWRVPSQ